MKTHQLLSVIISPLFAFSVSQAPPALLSNFLTPPDAARPRVWWHWMNGNITKEGITKDLEWMKRVGIGGFKTSTPVCLRLL